MKKLLTLIAFAFVAFTVDAQSTQKGDVNGDGDISVNDVAMIVNYILGIIDSNFIIANADVNGDGEIDINDVMGTVSTILEGDNTPQAFLTCPDDQHPHLIDLGLPSGTLWACCNVGAMTPEGYGGYYAWGETNEKSVYNEVTYQYCTGENPNGYGWYESNNSYQSLGSDIAGTQYDVAHVQWGGSWVMPSQEQQDELHSICTITRTTLNGVDGVQFTGPNGGTIFLPAEGYRWRDDLFHVGSRGFYWSSTQSPTTSYCAYYLIFDSVSTVFEDMRIYGFTVRPVSK